MTEININKRYKDLKKTIKWKKKNVEKVVKCRRNRKKYLIELKGGKCIKCGYNKVQFPSAFHFHHRDPKEKEFQIDTNNCLEKNLKEIEKCDLLCANCHAEIHDSIFIKSHKKTILKWKNIDIKRETYKILKKDKICQHCNIKFNAKSINQKYCNINCTRLASRKVERPNKEQLLNDILNNSWTKLGKKYQVSYTTVKKWAKGYGLI